MQAVYEKCLHDTLQRYKPLSLMTDNKLVGVGQIAEQMIKQQIAAKSIEPFVSQNMNGISNFGKDNLTNSFKSLIGIYKSRVDQVETDKWLMIELHASMQ